MSRMIHICYMLSVLSVCDSRTIYAGLENGQSVAVVEQCTLSENEHGLSEVVYLAMPGDVMLLESLQGSRAWLRGTTVKGWANSRSLASLPDAERIFSRWISQRQNLSGAYYGRGVIRGIWGDFREALADFSTGMKLDPANLQLLNARGKVHLRLRQPDLAIADFTECIRLSSGSVDQNSNVNCADSSYHRGFGYFEKGKLDEAIADYDQAIKLVPKMELAYNRRGMALRLKGEVPKALLDFEKSIALSPNFTAPRNFRAITLAELGRYREAITEYENAVAIAPAVIFITGTISQDLHLRLSESQNASVEDYWKLDATYSIQNNLAHLLLMCPDQRLRNPKRARELVTILRNKDRGQYYEFLKTEALVLASEGRDKEARQLLTKAAEAAPPDQREAIMGSLASADERK